MQIQTGQRFKPERLGVARCTDVAEIKLGLMDASIPNPAARAGWVTAFNPGSGYSLSLGGRTELDTFARLDGFAGGWAELLAFWRKHNAAEIKDGVFSGILIRWEGFAESRVGPVEIDEQEGE